MLEETPVSPELSRSVSALTRSRSGCDLAPVIAFSPEDPAVCTPAERSCAVAGDSTGSVMEAVGPGTVPIDRLTYK